MQLHGFYQDTLTVKEGEQQDNISYLNAMLNNAQGAKTSLRAVGV
jgi:hypothetical protein